MSVHPTPSYETWLGDYRPRREHLFRPEVMRVSEEAFHAAAPDDDGAMDLSMFGRQARARRATLTHKFCIVLWARLFNREKFARMTADQPLDPDPTVAREILERKARNFLPRMSLLTRRLDEAGLYALMFFPEGLGGAPPEPLVLPASDAPIDRENPDSIPQWLLLFTGFTELAEAIIVEGNYGEGLEQELAHLADAGLMDRVLLFDNNTELYRADESRRWPLDQIADAVKYAGGF